MALPLIPVVDAVVKTVPEVDGNVNVVVPATAGADSVTLPDVSPEITTDAISIPYQITTHLLPDATVTD